VGVSQHGVVFPSPMCLTAMSTEDEKVFYISRKKLRKGSQVHLEMAKGNTKLYGRGGGLSGSSYNQGTQGVKKKILLPRGTRRELNRLKRTLRNKKKWRFWWGHHVRGSYQ